MDEKKIFVASAAAIVVFELIKTYERQAPSLAICRAASPDVYSIDHQDVKTQLNDADLTMGAVALIVGGTFAYQSKDWSILLLTLGGIAVLSFARHHILSSTDTSQPR